MEKHTEEIDLFYVMKKLKNIYRGWLARGYHAVQFLKKQWIILTIIIVGGHFAGKFLQQSLRQKYEAVIIMQNNFGSSSYVYDAINTLNLNCQKKDKLFLDKLGLGNKEHELIEIRIEPIISMRDLLETTSEDNRNLATYTTLLDSEDDLMSSEVFHSNYQYHRVIVKTFANNEATINNIIDYLNNNDAFNAIKDVVRSETQLTINRNNKTIDLIDDLLVEYSGRKDEPLSKIVGTDFPSVKINNSLHELISKKIGLMSRNEYLLTELTKYDSIVAVVNSPKLVKTNEFLDKKGTLIPLGLVLLFFGYFWLKSLYLKGKKHATGA